MSKYILIGFSLIIYSCVFEPTPKRIVGNYFLSEVNGQTDISYNLTGDQFVGVIEPQIVEIGYNSDFIIAKKRSMNFGNDKASGEIEYYIIPVEDKVTTFPDDNKIGPLNEIEFKEKLNSYRIDNINFTISVQ